MINENLDRYLNLDKLYVYSDNIYQLNSLERLKLQELATSITNGNNLIDVLHLASWVSKIPWDISPENIHPLKLIGNSGDCYFHSLLFAALARTLGIPTRFVEEVRRVPEDVVKNFPIDADTFGKNFTFHVWCEVFVEGNWTPVDPTENVVGREDFELYFKNPDFFKIKVVRDEKEDVTKEYVLEPLKQYAIEYGLIEIYEKIEEAYADLNRNVGSLLYYCRPLYEKKEGYIEKLYLLFQDFNRNIPKKYIAYRGFISVEIIQSWLAHLWEYEIRRTDNIMIITDTELIKDQRRYEDFVINGGSLLVAAMNNMQIFDIVMNNSKRSYGKELNGKACTPFGYFEDMTLFYTGEMSPGDMYIENMDGSEENSRICFGTLRTKGMGRVAVVNYTLLMPYRDHRLFMKHLMNWLFDVKS